MIKKLLAALTIAACLFSCSGGTKSNPVTDTDVASAFIRSVLDNDFKSAEKYLLTDEANKQYFETSRNKYQAKDKEELKKYAAADIIINNIDAVSDSVHIVDYSNSYKKDEKTKLKLSWIDGKWLVDLKYTFEGK